ncbi:hypothetical protein PUG46_15530, partial [Erwiniaceae bacterium L1_55_4]|nr:hypothetical protein [Erwiniaceae bacterium L1_55_4]
VDVVCVHGISPAEVGCHVSVDPVAAKGKGASTKRGHKGATAKSFCGTRQKVFTGVHFTPFCTNRRCNEKPSAPGMAGTAPPRAKTA